MQDETFTLDRRRVVTGMLGLGALGVSGCAIQEGASKILQIILDPSIPVGEPEDQPSELSLSTYGSRRMNPNFDGQSVPISILIFALKSDHLIYEYDFTALAYDAEFALGPTLVETLDEVQVMPGKFKVIRNYQIPEGTRNIGFVARFNNIEDATWRASAPVMDRSTTENMLLSVSGNRISVIKQDT